MTQAAQDDPFDASTVVVLRGLARKAKGMSGADIERVVREARRKARRESRQVAVSDLDTVLTGTRRPRSLFLRFRMAVHEAGHAVARLRLDFGTILEITIGAPGGGYITGTRADDEATEEALTAELIVTLAGRAAEEEVVGTVSASSGGVDDSDLGLATGLALKMETVLGFNRKRPLLYRKAQDVSEVLAVDSELAARVNARLQSAYDVARKIVREQRAAVDLLGEALMELETLEGPELDILLEEARKRMTPPA